MNLQGMRDYVRAQLDLDDTDLPDVLLDGYIQEGYDRVLALEQPLAVLRAPLVLAGPCRRSCPDADRHP